MINVKKLITGFLILAVAGGAAALIISTVGNSSAANGATNITQNSGNVPAQTAAISGNAFVAQNTDQTVDAQVFTDDNNATGTDAALASSTNEMMNDPNNLTGILANIYVNNMVSENPGGATEDVNGDPTLTAPDTDSVIAAFASSTSQNNLQVPDWNTEIDQVPINVVSSTPAALQSYGTALGSILNQDIVSTDLEDTLNNFDANEMGSVESDITSALQDISGLKTPASMVDLQKSLIETLVYSKNELALGQTATVDPLKTELVLQAEDPGYQTAVGDLQTQLQTIQSENLFSDGTSPTQNQNNVVATLQGIFGIPVANAQWAVFDPVGDAGILATVANMIKAEVKDIILQLVKNSLVFIMQKTIISAIQGSGAPAFIQDWAKTAALALQQTALNALNSQMSCVGAAPFAAQMRIALQATYQPNTNVCAVQFTSQLSNNLTGAQNFYNHFSNGSWLTFGQSMQPGNNYYGSLYFTAQAIGQTAQNGQTAARSKATASQGFTGTAVCDDGSNPSTGTSLNCVDSNGTVYYPLQNGQCPSGTTANGSSPNNGLCADGSMPQVQTPGTIAANMVGASINGNFSLVTSATDWEGLASGLLISILQETLNSLAKTTIASVNGLLQQAYNSGGSNGVTSSTNAAGLTVYTSAPAQGDDSITCLTNADSSSTYTFSATDGVSISATGGVPSVSSPQYSWSGDVTTNQTGDTLTASFPQPGNYNVVVTATNPDGTVTSSTCPTAQVPAAAPNFSTSTAVTATTPTP